MGCYAEFCLCVCRYDLMVVFFKWNGQIIYLSIASFTQPFRKIHRKCVPWFVPGWSDFGSFTLPVIFRNLCVRSHTTRKDPVKTRDISCDVYNAPRTLIYNREHYRSVAAHHFTKLANDFSFSADSEELPDRCFIPVYTFFVVWTLICLQNTR